MTESKISVFKKTSNILYVAYSMYIYIHMYIDKFDFDRLLNIFWQYRNIVVLDKKNLLFPKKM